MSTRVELTVSAGIAWITLDGPKSRNALDESSVQALIAACDQVDDDRDIGVAVITGQGSVFCSGADRALLKRLQSSSDADRLRGLETIYAGFRRFSSLTVVTVAAVNGPAVGAGMNLALAADVRVLSTTAVLTSGFVGLGIHPGGGHLHLIRRASNSSFAVALGALAQSIDAARAVSAGLAWTAVEPDTLRPAVEELVRPLARDPELGRAIAKDVRQTLHSSDAWDRAIAVEHDLQAWSLGRSKTEA